MTLDIYETMMDYGSLNDCDWPEPDPEDVEEAMRDAYYEQLAREVAEEDYWNSRVKLVRTYIPDYD